MKRKDTLVFSLVSYSAIAAVAFSFIQYRVGLRTLLFLSEKNHQPLSDLEYNAEFILLLVGMGAFVCLVFLLGVTASNLGVTAAPAFFNTIDWTMQVRDREHETIGGLLFSDYQRKPGGIVDAVRLQASSMIHCLIKIILLPLNVASLHFIPMTVFAVLLVLPELVLGRPVPVAWYAVTFFFLFVFCYRAELITTAKRKGTDGTAETTAPSRIGGVPSLESSMPSAPANKVTYDFILRVLTQDAIVKAIKADMEKTTQIGCKEMWRLGLITPDQDVFDPSPSPLSRQEQIKKIARDSNYRLNRVEQIPLKRTAVLFNTTVFGTQADSLVVTGGLIKPAVGIFPGWSYPVSVNWQKGEYFTLRNIQMGPSPVFTEHRNRHLPQFLREDGFPLRDTYPDGDPLTADRGGIVVLDKGRLLIIYPRYFVQRRLMDDEGSLVDIGLDEGINSNPMFDVKMRPSVSDRLIKFVYSNGYTPVLRYRSVPYASEYMFPIVDTPMSCSGWADLYIDTRGKAKLFIAKEKSHEEWVEMMNRLKQLFISELAKKGNHLLAFHKDKAHLNNYLYQKLMILRDYFTIRDWQLV